MARSKNYLIITYSTKYSAGKLIIEKDYYIKKCKVIMRKLKDCTIISMEEITQEQLDALSEN